MYTVPPKKLLIFQTLEILRQETDAEHRLSQRRITELLRSRYQMSADRKAIKRNLMDLLDAGCQLEYTAHTRRGRDGEPETVYTDWYLLRDFTDAELRLLIDSVLFSKHLPASQCRALITKLEGLSNRYFRARVRHVSSLPEHQADNKALFYTIEILDEAISNGRQVQFLYNNYDTDKKLHPRLTEAGEPRIYRINPYQMVAANGRYYLICNYDKYDSVSNYRLDRITDIQLLSTPRKPMQQVRGLEHGLDLPRHMAEHIYMYSGESGRVTFRASRAILNDIIDWFGCDVTFSDETADTVTASVVVNLQAMRKWARQYAGQIRLLSPQKLVDEIRLDLQEALAQYTPAED